MNLEVSGPATADPDAMVLVPGGTYEVGCDRDAYERLDQVAIFSARLHTLHSGRVSVKPFYMSIFPVTNIRFEQVVPRHRRSKYTPADDHPVVDITFYEALAYCKARGVRLPSAIEWEVAAKGPENYAYSNAPTIDHARCNFFPSEGPNLMGEYPPNSFGLFDMCGNVIELTSTKVAVKDEDFVVVAKGGSWGSCQYAALAFGHLYVDPMLRSNRVGFRTARDAVG